ncbi:MAG: hypothetical protein ACREBA_09005 [Nitrosotalea sp.]
MTITEVTNSGFKYEFDLEDRYSQKVGYTSYGVPEFGMQLGGEVYMDTINQYGLFDMMYTEINGDTRNGIVNYQISSTYNNSDGDIEWVQVQV